MNARQRLRADLIAARVPRYTSYPTAPHFNASVTAPTVRHWLSEIPQDDALSLYFHVPFCDTLCWFCGCHTRVVNHYGPIKAYVDLLLKEIDLVAAALQTKRAVSHIHFGGGSPTILSAEDIDRIAAAIRSRFDVRPDAEFAVEIDPRGLKPEIIAAFARAGVNRASIGVQDANPDVQRAVNRWQPLEVTRTAIQQLRAAGIGAINIDLMYGLPYQTVANVRATVDRAVELGPQRLAVFGYAHVPQMKRHQELIDASALPNAEQRLQQYDAVHARLVAHDYQPIGLDHFALPSDPLAVAQRTGKLSRNFQGYTTDGARTLIGFGASAISSYSQGYAQNAAAVPDYRQSLMRNDLPIARGRAVTAEDRFRADIIERLMCDLHVDLEAVAERHGRTVSLRQEFTALRALEQQGLVRIDGAHILVPDAMRAGVRLVCAVFDAYLQPEQGRHAVAV
ncbi:MAG: oxygen-independent coproporphyrinogen III oxidase [Alphaproteobacteria bacterium]|nr:oxygen-independent coproporphyrinogen III oxidase [Alphaproteobacteria bacterium]